MTLIKVWLHESALEDETGKNGKRMNSEHQKARPDPLAFSVQRLVIRIIGEHQ